MLNFYWVLANRLYPYRPIIWILAVVAVGLFLSAVFRAEPAGNQTYELASIILLLWALGLVGVVQCFAAPLPAIDPGAPWLTRLRARIVHGFRWFMALTTTALFGLIILFSFKAVGLLLRA